MTVQVNRTAAAFELSGVVGKRFRKVKLSVYTGKTPENEWWRLVTCPLP
jgi:hypothetical protein